MMCGVVARGGVTERVGCLYAYRILIEYTDPSSKQGNVTTHVDLMHFDEQYPVNHIVLNLMVPNQSDRVGYCSMFQSDNDNDRFGS